MRNLRQFLFPHTFSRQGVFLLLLTFAMGLSLDSWMVMVNNFTVDRIAFDGADIGLLQSLREIPGFLAFLAVYLLLFCTEQRLALFFLLLLGLGTALTGFFASFWGIVYTTLVMSIGFHFYETYSQSLSMQWVDKKQLPSFLGSMSAVHSLAALISYTAIWLLMGGFGISYIGIYVGFGSCTILLAIYAFYRFPGFSSHQEQHKKFLLRRRYSLFYILTFFSGARRQIFLVFAGFLMVERFGFAVEHIALLFLGNHLLNMLFAPLLGRFIAFAGERISLIIEYVGLVGIFIAYALVDHAILAVALYVVDHLFYALRIAIKSYFQKIADPADLAATAAVSFTINHIAAVLLPVLFGLVWLHDPDYVFLAAAFLALSSLFCAFFVPRHPAPGHEVSVPYLFKRLGA